jgi:hypothetical protein
MQDGAGNLLSSSTRGAQQPLSVQILDASGNQVTTFGGAGGTASNFGSAFPTPGTAVGFNDGTNMVPGRVLAVGNDAVSNSTPSILSAAWNYMYNGTTWDRLRGDTTNGVWVNVKTSATVPASQSGNWSTRIQDGTGNNLTSVARGTQQPLSVQVVDGSGNQITNFGSTGGTSSSFGNSFPAVGTAAGYSDGTNMQPGRIVTTAIDANANTTPQIISGAFNYMFNGTTWDRWRGDTTNGAWVNVKNTANVAIHDAAGNNLTSQTRGTQQPLSVQILDSSGNQVTSFGGAGGTASNFGSTFPVAGTAAGYSDGTNMVSGRVIATAADATSNATPEIISGAFNYMYNGTTWDRIRGSTTNGILTQISNVNGNGQATSANSSPVVIASDQSNLPNNLKQVNGATISLGQTTMSASLPVTMASNQSALPIASVAAATGGASTTGNIVPNNTTGVTVKASAGTLYGVQVYSINTPVWLKIYNTTSATCGSGTPVKRLLIPAAATVTNGNGSNITFGPQGIAFSTGISYCVTGGIADADTTLPAASSYTVNIDWN